MRSIRALEACARRVAAKAGLIARKSRWRSGSVDNFGGFMLINDQNHVVAGNRFEITAQEVIEYCKQ